MEYIFLILFLLVLIFAFYITFFYKSWKKLQSSDLKKFRKIHDDIIKNKTISNWEKILNLDKLYHKILLSVQYNWTFWEILKKNPIIIWDINKIWELHKLRNKLAHEFLDIDDSILSKKVIEFSNEIKVILKKLS